MFRIGMSLFALLLGLSLLGSPVHAQDKKDEKKKDEKKKAPVPPVPATFAKVPYGKHERQVLDFYQAKSDKPTPVVLYIHGGGWQGGDKNSVGNVKPYLDAGISVAAINYRYVKNGVEEKVEPPVKAPLEDAARDFAVHPLQGLRMEYRQETDRRDRRFRGRLLLPLARLPQRYGRPQIERPGRARIDPSLLCSRQRAQTSLDPKELLEWLPNYTYGAHAFGLKDIKELSAKREGVLKWIQEYSPIEHVSKDDPPIGLFYGGAKDAKVGGIHPDPTHSPVMGMKLQERLKSVGVECVLAYTGHPDPRYASAQAFLIDHLKK